MLIPRKYNINEYFSLIDSYRCNKESSAGQDEADIPASAFAKVSVSGRLLDIFCSNVLLHCHQVQAKATCYLFRAFHQPLISLPSALRNSGWAD